MRKYFLIANNIFLTFTFTKDIHRESFPLKISVVLNTLVEQIFLEKTPSTVSSDELVPIQSNLLEFTFDPAAYRGFDGIQTVVTFQLIGVPDFGSTVEEIHIWQDKLDLSVLSAVQLKDDVRQWDEEYQPYPTINGYLYTLFFFSFIVIVEGFRLRVHARYVFT